ncbi:MAG: hypothetical protein HEQ38_15100 [Gemmatimonas sp.]|nr:hypothetical protein [Gemmatimonas sp.]
MTHPDLRTLKPAARAEKWRIAVAIREEGLRFSDIGRALVDVSKCWDRYQDGGANTLATPKSGPAVGAHRCLTAKQQQSAQRAIADTTPYQLKLSFASWNRAAAVHCIERNYGFTLPVRTMGLDLARWGVAAYSIAARRHTKNPRIKRLAAARGAEIYLGDETSLSASDPRGRGFAPRGKTFVCPILPPRRSFSYLSAIYKTGLLRVMTLKMAVDAPMRITFFKRLCKDAERTVVLILGDLIVHKATGVHAWIAANAELIAIQYLPPHAP